MFKGWYTGSISITKSEFYKIRPGSILHIRWHDSEDTLAIALEKPERQLGEVYLRVLSPEGTFNVTNDQVVFRGCTVWSTWD